MKRSIGVLLIAVVLIFTFAGQIWASGKGETESSITIAYVGMASSQPFWVNLGIAAKEEADEQEIDFLDLTPAEQSVDLQKSAIDNAVLQGVDGIIIGAVDSRGLDDSLNKAKEAGIPVICVDTGVEHPWVSSLIQTDNLAAARIAGDFIVDTLNKKGITSGKVLILGGSVGHQTGDARKNGVTEKVEAAGFKVIYRPADWDAGKAQEIAQNELAANEDIVAIFGCWDPGIVAAIPPVNAKGLLGDMVMVGFDGLPMGLKAIQSGEINASIAQDTTRMGKEGVQLMIDLINGKSIPDFIPIDGVVIDINNVESFME